MTSDALDFSRWAVVAYNDDTGLGRMAQDIRRVLGLGRHLVAPSERLATKPLGNGDFLLTKETPADEIRAMLAGIDGVILLERPSWNEALPQIARELGVAVVAAPMWEWFNLNDPCWEHCDLLACPNRKCLEVVRKNGFANAVELTWPLDLERLPHRNISGPARVFVHNAGLVDRDDRKGTGAVLRAFGRLKNPELRLIVRMQKKADFPETDDRVELRIGNVADVASLWSEGEAAVQPSKLEGIGFMVLEPVCAGLPVITVDSAPMNEYPAAFLVPPQWLSKSAFASQWVPHARLRPANIASLAKAMEACTRTDLADASNRQRAWAEERFAVQKLRGEWANALAKIASNKMAAA